MSRRSIKRYITGGIGLLLAVAAWFLFAPQQLGGAVAYTIVSGSSMEPHLHEGDLAITREKASYDPGDVVAYQNSQLDSVVLHRVVRIEDGRLVMKGDNNDFLDVDKPMLSEVMGAQWIRIPVVGGFLQKVREPRVAAPIVAILSAMALGLFGFKRTKRPRQSGRRDTGRGSGGTLADLLPSAAAAEKTVAGLALAAACMVGLAVFAFARPTSESVADKIVYEHRGTLTYSADAPAGPVYPDGRLETGDPVFLNVVDEVTFNFSYEFTSEAPHSVSGEGRLVAELSDMNGWARTFVIDASGSLQDDRVTLTGELDLSRMTSVVAEIRELTGVTSDALSLTITPEVRLEGTLSGRPLSETFSSGDSFQLDALQLHKTSAGEDDDSRGAIQGGFVEVMRARPATVPVLGRDVPVSTLRRVGLIGTLLTVLTLIFLTRPLWSHSRDEITRIQARYGARLVPVTHIPRSLGDAIEVADMHTLVQLAEGYERVILHLVDGDLHSYVVEDDSALYVYRARASLAHAEGVTPELA